MSNPEGGYRLRRETGYDDREDAIDRPNVEWTSGEMYPSIDKPVRSRLVDYIIKYLVGCGVLANVYLLYYIL
jgi:hypothetical protein